MRRTRSTQSAFTLIEVLVVVVIIGIAGAVVVPQMLHSGSMTVQAAGRVVIADLLIAQSEAIAQQSPRRVVFDAPNNRYWLADDTGKVLGVGWKSGGAAGENYVVDFNADRRFSGVGMGTLSFGGESFVQFDTLGTPSNGGNVTLISGSVQYRISVAPITGRVTIAPLTGGL